MVVNEPYIGSFTKICQHIFALVKIRQQCWTLPCRLPRISARISRVTHQHVYRSETYFRRKVVEKNGIHYMLNKLYP